MYLKFQPTGRLVPCSIIERPFESFLAVGRVSGRAVPNERSKELDEPVGRREASDTQRQKDPPASVRRLGRVVRQLFADVTIDFVAEFGAEDAVTDDEMKLFQVGGRTGFQPGVVRVSGVLFLLQ